MAALAGGVKKRQPQTRTTTVASSSRAPHDPPGSFGRMGRNGYADLMPGRSVLAIQDNWDRCRCEHDGRCTPSITMAIVPGSHFTMSGDHADLMP